MTPLKTALGIVFIICLTIVIFTFITRGKLCELTIKSEGLNAPVFLFYGRDYTARRVPR